MTTEDERHRAMGEALVDLHGHIEDIRRSLNLTDMDILWVVAQIAVGRIGVLRESEKNEREKPGALEKIFGRSDSQ